MTDLDLNIITQLVNDYGIEEIENIVKLYKGILTYIYNTRFKDSLSEKESAFLYSENDSTITFTNEKTSIFFLNKKIFDLKLLTQNKDILSSKTLLVESSDMKKYFDKSQELFGNNGKKIILNNNIYGYNINNSIDYISRNEFELISLLLKNPKVFCSEENPVIYAEGELGYAYVLGKKNNKYLKY